MDKVNSIQQISDHQTDISLKKHSLNQNELTLKLKKLSYLALNFDPYSPNLEDETLKNLLVEFQLESFLSNPFQFTNQLLLLIDQTENTLKSLAQ